MASRRQGPQAPRKPPARSPKAPSAAAVAAGGIIGGTPAPAAGAAALATGAKAQRVVVSNTTTAILSLLQAIHLRRRKIIANRVSQAFPDSDIGLAMEEEERREVVFRKRVEQRLRAGMKLAQGATDPSVRAAAIQALMKREQRYAEMRSAAAGERVLAAAELQDLRTRSPRGAFWALGPRQRHTPDCVQGDALWAGPKARRGFRRPYTGQLIEIMVASGEELAVTPNHPVLTSVGWRPAEALRKGDQIISHRPSHAIVGEDQDVGEMPTIEQVVDSLENLPGARSTTLRPYSLNLHGDIADREVHVVSAHGGLDLELFTALTEQTLEPSLVGGDPALMSCPRCGGALGTGLVPGLPNLRLGASESGSLDSGALLGGQRGKGEFDGLASLAADLDAAVEQDALEASARDASLLGKTLHGLPGAVTLDEVVKVGRKWFDGHVFNVSTDGGWYTVNGLIVKNCVAMSGRFWPWRVLNEVHPLLHVGCGCHLYSFGTAISEGLMSAEDIPSDREALKLAATVIQHVREEQAEAERRFGHLTESATEELLIRAALQEQGADANLLAAAPLQCDAEMFPPDAVLQEAAAKHSTGAMVALYPSAAEAKKLAISGGLPPEELHVTLGYLGKAKGLDLDKAKAAVEAWAKKTPKLSGELSGVGHFDIGAGTTVTYRSVDLPALPAPREALVKALDAAGTPPSREHGFSPHLTLDERMRRVEIKKQPISFGSVFLVWGEDRYEFKLTGKLPERP